MFEGVQGPPWYDETCEAEPIQVNDVQLHSALGAIILGRS